MNAPTLETDRLILRMWREEDFEPYARMCADAEVMKYLGGEALSRLDAWRQMAYLVGHWQMRGYGHFAVEEKGSGRFVGRIGFLNPEGWPGFEIGWALDRSCWGKGFAIEGARRALEYAFSELDQPHVISLIHAENRTSIRVAEKLGERLEGKSEVMGIEVRVYGIDRPWSSSS